MKIERKQLKEIEFLFNQSTKGIHLLFEDNKKLAHILSTPTKEKAFFDSKNMDKNTTRFLQVLYPEKV